jgi:phage terminase small subunit
MKASESDVSSNQAGNWLSREAQKIFRHVASLLVDAMQYEVTGSLKCQKPLFRN